MAFSKVSRLGIVSLLAVVLVVGVFAMLVFTRKQTEHELTRWQDKLNLIADARARDVNGWMQAQRGELAALANNASLPIYFLSLQSQAAAPVTAPRPTAQADYLRNLLTTTAERLGFQPAAVATAPQSRANARKLVLGGLALVDMTGHQLMATSAMPPLTEALATKIAGAPRGQVSLLDIEQMPDGTQRMGFVAPIYAVQADHTAANQIGMLVGIRPVDDKFFALLNPAPVMGKSLDVALVRAEGNRAHYLTPLRDQSPVMATREAKDENSAAGYALAHPGDFAQKSDYRAQDVLVTGRTINDTPWVLLVKIDRAEALAESAAWRHTMLAAIGLFILAAMATLSAVWRHANLQRAQDLSQQAQAFATVTAARAELLALVTNHQPEPLYIVDGKMQLWFANQAAADTMRSTAADMQGKSLNAIAGAALSYAIAPYCTAVLETNMPMEQVILRATTQGTRTIAMRFIPLASIPVDGLAAGTAGVLITEQDVTELLEEREKRAQTLQQLVATLVSLVDRRDPNAAQHSAHVAAIAEATARSMGLDTMTVETTETAARLMNLGKMDIPAELLQRPGALNPDERNQLRSSLAASASLLDGIAFAGPVTDTLRQAQERADGTGPMQLSGEDILVSARIIAAANAAVGMLSPRAYRKPIAIGEVVKLLQADTRFDPKVVAALTSFLLNHAEAAQLQAISRANVH